MTKIRAKVVAIIPARDEEHVIADCVRNVLSHNQITQVVVVCDQCKDRTHEYACAAACGDRRCVVLDKTQTEGTRPHLGHRVAEVLNFGLEYLGIGGEESNQDIDCVIQIGADTRLPPGYLEKALSVCGDGVGAVTIKSGTTRNGAGTMISRAALHDIGDHITSCALDDTCLHNMIEACGYHIAEVPYNRTQFLVPDPPRKRTVRHRYWGHRGRGYAEYEMCLGWMGIILILASFLRKGDGCGILYVIGYLEAWFRRAPQIEMLRKYSQTRQNEWIVKAKAKCMRKSI